MTPHLDVAIVVPTIGRASLLDLIAALNDSPGISPAEVIIVDDRPSSAPALLLPVSTVPLTLLRSGGRGPAAARNVGWRSATARWICFLDDDVVPADGWLAALKGDLAAADADGAVGSQGRIEVPVPSRRRLTDDERRTERLAGAQWITADLAYRRSALVQVGGFDERFPRAYREDSDLALRVTRAGGRIDWGTRRSIHPVAPSSMLSAVRAQVGNADDALMRRKHGRGWRTAIGEGRGRIAAHAVTTAAALTAVLGVLTRRARPARLGAAVWVAMTTEFWLRRYLSGPRGLFWAVRLLITSVVIPPVAVRHRIHGTWSFCRARREPPLAVLFDRDDTIIEDGPYLNDPAGVVPVPGAAVALNRLREQGLLLGVVTNQSGVASGLISPDQLEDVNAKVNSLLGPFDSWQVCPHASDAGCVCRKPSPGMVHAAAEALGVPTSRCVLIGDTGSDVEAALAADAEAILVPTARTLPQEIESACRRARVASTLTDAVNLVLRECR
jgi:histidinol-phosphate phosphatase family protein